MAKRQKKTTQTKIDDGNYNMKFIYTDSEETKNYLLSLDYKLIKSSGTLWIFKNKINNVIKFDKDKNIVFSDILTF